MRETQNIEYKISWRDEYLKWLIIDECTNARLPEPAFKYDANGLMVEFKGKPVVAPEKIAGETRESGGETSVKVSVKVSVKTSVKILELMKGNPEITMPELASIVGVSKRSIERNIQKLQNENLLKRVGADKGGHWEVIA